MRICIPNPLFHPFEGGIENHILSLGARLSRTHEIHVVTSQTPGTEPFSVIDGVHVHRLPAKIFNIYSPPATLARGVREKISQIQPDIIHLHNRWSPEYASATETFMGRIPVVLTWHNDFGEGVGWQRPLSYLNDLWFRTRIAQRSSMTVCISRYVKRRLLSKGMEEDALRVIYNGVDLRERSRREDDFILYVGRLVPTKGLDVLAEAMRWVDTRLVVCGDGPLSRVLAQAPNVELLGRVEPGTKEELIERCSFLVLPSRMESFGLVLLEAMAAGKPVIATRVGGIPEVVGDGGIIVEPDRPRMLAEAIDGLLSDPFLRRRLGRRAWRRAALLSWDEAARRLEQVYEEVSRS